MAITNEFYGRTKNGEDVYQYTLSNEHGMRVQIIEYGCIITNIWAIDNTGEARDVVLGCNTLENYEIDTAGLGAFVGRVANRIENSTFSVGGKSYLLTPNNGKNHLHGVFQKKVFKGSISGETLSLTLTSPDGEDGFPGELEVTVSYTLTAENALVLEYTAVSDAPTIANFTNHSYFNLDGHTDGTIADQTLQINAKEFLEGNAETCPTGKRIAVEGTVFDFLAPAAIGKGLASNSEQIKLANGYDHNYILDKTPGELALAAVAHSPKTGLTMTTYTTQPGIQLYTSNFLQNTDAIGKTGGKYAQYQAFCLETQHFPCTPSHPEFPSITLLEDEEYHETTIYQFSVVK